MSDMIDERNENITVAFVVNDIGAGKYDGERPELGNPGVGGTQYCFLSLAAKLSKNYSNLDVTLYHNNSEAILPAYLNAELVSGDETDLIKKVAKSKADYVVIRGSENIADHNTLFDSGLNVVVWVHNHLSVPVLDFLGMESSIKHVVFCGYEQRELAYDTACYIKSTTILNMHYPFYPTGFIDKDKYGVVYIGSVIPSKGLHRLIRLWPRIKKNVPLAKLHVIGSGALYDKNQRLGAHGLAESKYEKRIFRYLDNKPKEYDVIFHGLMGREKFSIIEMCSVAIPNPTALTECCPGSVLECSSMGLPVVGRKKFGMIDTIDDGVTGHLIESDKEFVEKIVEILNDSEGALKLGRSGIEYVSKNFSSDLVADKWNHLFSNTYDKSLTELPRLRGKYLYSPLILINPEGRNKALRFLRVILGKLETAVLKLR